MKHSWIRLLSLTLLLALLAGAMPALAADAPFIDRPQDHGDVFWQGMRVMIQVRNLPEGATVISAKSAKPSIIRIDDFGDGMFHMFGVKGGKSKVTARYRLKNGKVKSVSANVTVKNYPKAIKSIALNGKKLRITPTQANDYRVDNYNNTATTLKVTPNSGWKLESLELIMIGDAGSKRITPKNGKKVSTPRKYTTLMWHICLSNARGQQYDFNLILFRP